MAEEKPCVGVRVRDSVEVRARGKVRVRVEVVVEP